MRSSKLKYYWEPNGDIRLFDPAYFKGSANNGYYNWHHWRGPYNTLVGCKRAAMLELNGELRCIETRIRNLKAQKGIPGQDPR